MTATENETPAIDVCDSCLRRCCWEGIFYCDNYKNAGLVKKTMAELCELDREHKDYFMPAFVELETNRLYWEEEREKEEARIARRFGRTT